MFTGKIRKRITRIGGAASLALLPLFALADDLDLPPPPPPQMTEILDQVYYYFDNFYISMVVVTEEGAAITDPGGPERAARLELAIRKLTDKPVTRVIYSHDHYDHARGGKIFKDAGATFISHEKCMGLLQNDPLGQVIPPDITYDGQEYSIELGGKTIELRHFGPSDGRCMSIFYMPEQKIIQAVDVHLNGMLVTLDHLYSHEYVGVLNTLRRIRDELDYEHVVNGHLPNSSPEWLDRDLEFVETLYKEVLNGIKNGDSLDILKSGIKIPAIEDWQFYEQNLPAHVERMYYAINHGG